MPLDAIELPEKLSLLFEPWRYKVIYGGRNGAKSWNIARALLIKGLQERIFVVCAREIQKSIRDSVHRLLDNQIDLLGMREFYDVQQTIIRGVNGTEFVFAGLKHNVHNIKSLEGADIVWIEEAQNTSKHTWQTLIPTVRKPGSEIWVSFNPELDTDETYKRFVISPPPNAKVVKIGWEDNNWLSAESRVEIDHLRQTDPDAFLNVYGGHCKAVLDGAIFAKEIREGTEAGRLSGRVPIEQSKPVHTFWDLGRADKTSIWFVQQVGFEFRIVDFYENRGEALAHYLKAIQARGYVYGEHWLPHDAENELLASERTIAQQMRASGFTVRIVPKVSVADGINAARTLFPNCWFDAERCADGLNSLRRYRYDVDPETGQYSRLPLHDDASHAADAFRYFAVAMREKKAPTMKLTFKRPPTGAGSWMA